MKKLDISIFNSDKPLKEEGYIEIPGTSGTIELPVYLIQGKKSPRITIVGAQHSLEYCGSDAIIRLIKDFRGMDAKEFNGSIVMIPVANIPGYPVKAYCVSQYDGTNLNRSYPGNPEGNNSERIANVIWSIAKTGDYVLDLHGGDFNEYIIQYAEMHRSENEDLNKKSWGLAACFDLDVILSSIAGSDYAYPDFRSLYGLAQSSGIAASIVEAGGTGICDEPSVEYFYEGLKKVFNHTKILTNKQYDREKKKVWVTRWVSCIERPNTGRFVSFVKAGEDVKRGQVIGQVTNYLGDVIEDIRSPRTGIVSLVQSCQGKSPGDMIYMIIDKEDGEFFEV